MLTRNDSHNGEAFKAKDLPLSSRLSVPLSELSFSTKVLVPRGIYVQVTIGSIPLLQQNPRTCLESSSHTHDLSLFDFVFFLLMTCVLDLGFARFVFYRRLGFCLSKLVETCHWCVWKAYMCVHKLSFTASFSDNLWDFCD